MKRNNIERLPFVSKAAHHPKGFPFVSKAAKRTILKKAPLCVKGELSSIARLRGSDILIQQRYHICNA